MRKGHFNLKRRQAAIVLPYPIILILLMLMLFMSKVWGQEREENTDKTLSPYFVVLSENDAASLPLKSTSANVNIAGVIADVKVAQIYKNEGKSPIEAIYVFPASTRAAVYGMTMKIGEREIVAVVQEKQAARQAYEQAKQEGKSASLLEQQRPNVFQMNVANIMPGDEVRVELNYTELLVPEGGIYEFVYPAVVGPRYSNKTESTAAENDRWVASPYTHQGTAPLYTFDISAGLATGIPVKDIRCLSHDVNINYEQPSVASVRLKHPNGTEGNRDFMLQYRLSGNRVESGLLLYRGKDENFFLAMMQPPAKVSQDQIPPREYIFIVDVSGSMYGFPLDVSKSLLKDLISHLKPTDRFNVLLFAGGSSVLSETSLPASEENIRKAIRFIENQQGGGGTELLPALKRALSMKAGENYSRSFIIATDGYVDVEKEAFDLICNNLSGASFFAFGIGTSVNRYLIEGIAHVGRGEPFIVLNEQEAKEKAQKFRHYIEQPVLTQIHSEIKEFQVYDVEPVTIPDVLAERPVILFGKWKGNPSGTITLNGKTAQGTYRWTVKVDTVKPSTSNIALKYLWARERIRLLDDFGSVSQTEELKNEITALGLKYNLLTNYTSFIAIDSEIRNKGGQSATIHQPLPLPEGVSDYAVGGIPGTVNGVYRMSATMQNLKSAEKKSIADTEADEEVFFIAGTMPEFPGGMDSLLRFIRENIRFSATSGTRGKVFVQFTVNPDGTVSNVRVIKGLDPATDKEVVRVIALTSGMWKPGMQRGKPVKAAMTIPVAFEPGKG